MKAVVMAGGEGTRLRPMTSSMPKPLLPVANRPIMEHVLRLLKRHGLNETVVTVQFLASLVKNYFGDGEELGMELTYANEEKPLGTAGSVKNAEEALKDDTFLVISGDALTDFDLTDLIAFHKEKGGLVTVCLTGFPIRWNSESQLSTRVARSSVSWRSPPGVRSSRTRSTPASM